MMVVFAVATLFLSMVALYKDRKTEGWSLLAISNTWIVGIHIINAIGSAG